MKLLLDHQQWRRAPHSVRIRKSRHCKQNIFLLRDHSLHLLISLRLSSQLPILERQTPPLLHEIPSFPSSPCSLLRASKRPSISRSSQINRRHDHRTPNYTIPRIEIELQDFLPWFFLAPEISIMGEEAIVLGSGWACQSAQLIREVEEYRHIGERRSC